MPLNAPLLASPHCLPLRSGDDTQVHGTVFHARSSKAGFDQHTVKAREACGSEAVTSGDRMSGSPQGPTPTACSPRLSCNRGASVQITSFDAAHAPSSAKHVSTVAVPHHRSTLQRRRGSPNSPLVHTKSDTPEAPTSVTDIDTTHAAGAQRSGHFDPQKYDTGRARRCCVAPAPRRHELRGPRYPGGVDRAMHTRVHVTPY